MKSFFKLALGLVLFLLSGLVSAQKISYMQPPKEIVEIISAKPLPEVAFSNDYKKAVISGKESSMSELSYIAGSEFRVAGLRIDNNFSNTRQQFSNELSILDVESGSINQVTGLPQNAKISNIDWSPSGKYFCFINNTPQKLELWRVDAVTAVSEKLNTLKLNAVLSEPYSFLDDERIMYKCVPDNAGLRPESQPIPQGPVVQEHKGAGRSARTSPDMIASYYDEQVFDYYATSQLALFSSAGNTIVGKPALYRSLSLSPNKEYMIVTTEQKPYSYQRGHQSYPYRTEVWNIKGEFVKMLEDNKVGNLSMRPDEDFADDTAMQDSVRTPKRGMKESNWRWRSDLPQTLVWNESEAASRGGRDGGNRPADFVDTVKSDAPKQKTFIYQQDAPFTSEKTILLKSEGRVDNLVWCNKTFALFTTTDSKAKLRNTFSFVPCDTTVNPRLLISQTTELDTIGNFPVFGRPYMVNNQFGEKILYTDEKNSLFYLTDSKRRDSEGDNFWFIDKIDTKTAKIENVWTGKAPFLETVEAITDFKKLKFISRKESNTDVPNYFLVDIKGKKSRQLTNFHDPYPSIQKMQRRFVSYKRADGLTLTANLYLPENYDPTKQGKLPVFMWGYPYEYKTRALAEKRRAARYAFARPGYSSPLYWATQGYAVLDDFAVPIVAENKKKEPNDRFIKELVMDAEAAINYLDSIGVGDKERVAVGGHSYGAFMTANLLAHTKLFKAGIARSGAYNRSLTPFGFQSESRNYWKAQSLYNQMSPFNYADSLKTPILLIHGQLDNNQGTFPVQSERLYHALAGLGGTVRYVQLPFEAHRYSAKESVLHVLYETHRWLEKYLKK